MSMHSDNAIREIDVLEPPKSPMSIYQLVEFLSRQEARRSHERNRSYDRILRIYDEIDKKHDESARQCKEMSEEFKQFAEYLNSKKSNQSEDTPEPIHQQPKTLHLVIKEQAAEITQLKEQVDELKEDNSRLTSQIQYFLEFLTSFFSNRVSRIANNWSSFFEMNKESSSNASVTDQEKFQRHHL